MAILMGDICWILVGRACDTLAFWAHAIPADIATKVVPGGAKRNHLVSKVLYDLAD